MKPRNKNSAPKFLIFLKISVFKKILEHGTTCKEKCACWFVYLNPPGLRIPDFCVFPKC